ncbi:MAG: hypothetical protein QM805_11295 [Pseudomonas sp.]
MGRLNAGGNLHRRGATRARHSLGIRQTPKEFMERRGRPPAPPLAASTRIRLPFALPSIMAGINQMMAFEGVVIAGMDAVPAAG